MYLALDSFLTSDQSPGLSSKQMGAEIKRDMASKLMATIVTVEGELNTYIGVVGTVWAAFWDPSRGEHGSGF